MWNPLRRKGERPPAVPTQTLAGAYAVGQDGGSGFTYPWVALDPVDAGGRVDELGRFVVAPSVQVIPDLPPDSLYADRPMFGGLRSAPAFAEFRDEPSFTGGHTVITGTPRVQLGEFSVVEATPRPSVREVPVPDGVGSCQLRAAAAVASGDLAALQRATLDGAIGRTR